MISRLVPGLPLVFTSARLADHIPFDQRKS
jgi:hypothetical protein